jgi:hypothetical protein
VKRAVDAYTKAWAEAKRQGDEAAKASNGRRGIMAAGKEAVRRKVSSAQWSVRKDIGTQPFA